MNTTEPNKEKYPWAGPALFTVVLIALVALFVKILS